MSDETVYDDPTAEIQALILAGAYRVRIHAVRHMIEEGFDENALLAAAQSGLRLLEAYSDEQRYLVLGHFAFSPGAISPLHLVCDFSNLENIDIITAYIPQRPWWISPTQRGRQR